MNKNQWINAWIAALPEDEFDKYVWELDNRFPEYLAEAYNDEEYAVWLMLSDRLLANNFCATRSDMPRWQWKEAYQGDMPPAVAVSDFLLDQMDLMMNADM